MPRRHAASARDPQLAGGVTWRPSTAARPPLPGELHDDIVLGVDDVPRSVGDGQGTAQETLDKLAASWVDTLKTAGYPAE